MYVEIKIHYTDAAEFITSLVAESRQSQKATNGAFCSGPAEDRLLKFDNKNTYQEADDLSWDLLNEVKAGHEAGWIPCFTMEDENGSRGLNRLRLIYGADGYFVMTYEGRRHGLHGASGSACIFRALGGPEWAAQQEVLECTSNSSAPWYECGVRADKGLTEGNSAGNRD